MSFTFKSNKSHPVAVVKSKKNKPKYIYLSNSYQEDSDDESKGDCILDEKLDSMTIEQITACLAKGLSLRQMYATLDAPMPTKKKTPTGTFRSYELEDDEIIEPIMSQTSERMFSAGTAGTGKSYVAAMLMRNYLKMFPKNKIYLFLRQDDKNYEDIPRTEYILGDDEFPEDTEAVINKEIKMEDFGDSFVIFDDMDNLQDKKLLTAVHKLMNDLVTSGRKKNIYVLYISHIIANYAQTKVIANEANKTFFFPMTGTFQIEAYLHKHAGMKKKDAEALVASLKRIGAETDNGKMWAMLSTGCPQFILHRKGIFML